MNSGSNELARMPSRGEIWLYDPDPVRGRKQANVRPGIIVSNDTLNRSVRGLVVIVPMTTTIRMPEEYPYHLEIQPELSGLRRSSVAMCEQVRSIATERLLGSRPRGFLRSSIMEQVEDRLRIVLWI